MGPQTRTGLSSKMDTDAVYCDLRAPVMRYVALVGATASTKSPGAVDMGAI